MRLTEAYRPQLLADIVGQPPARALARLAAAPYPVSVLLEGPPGVGKTASALAFAREIGCDEWSTHVVPCSEFSVDVARRMFEGGNGSAGMLRLRPLAGKWQVLILEELEWLSPQCQAYLKVALETKMPGCLIVLATSNGAGKLQPALLQRFKFYAYSGGQIFAACARERLAEVWQRETGSADLPLAASQWGWTGENEFSMRVALDQLQDAACMAGAA